MLFKLFDMYEKEAQRVVKAGLVLPAYDYVLKCSHSFNLLDAAGAISLSGTYRIYFPCQKPGPHVRQGLAEKAQRAGIPHA